MIARRWIGSYQIKEILNHSIDNTIPLPPESGSAYLVSQNSWQTQPTAECIPLYVGGNTGLSARFRTRVGDLLADAFGFFGDETGHSSGGKSLHWWCRENHINPMNLHLAWVERCVCHRCLEIELYRELSPLLNKKSPPRCKTHGGE